MKPTLKSLTILLSILLSSQFAAAQDVENVDRTSRLGLSWYGGIAYRQLHSSGSDPSLAEFRDRRNDTEIPYGSYHLGFNYMIPVGKHTEISLGANYTVLGYQTEEIDLIFQDPNDPFFAGTLELRYRYKYAEAPIFIRRYFGDKSLKLFGAVGAAPMVFLGSTTVQIIDGEFSSHADGTAFRRFSVSSQVELGASIELGETTRLNISGLGKYQLVPVIADAPIKEWLWSVGAQVGLSFAI